tara:strand:+ start:580 stop:1521 length:942 start_codon:yes stop_codon:yes gene_type:complete
MTNGIECSVCVSMGSTSIQGFYLTPNGEKKLLFFDDKTPNIISTKKLTESKESLLNFMEYLITFSQTNKKIVLYNSIGYSLDGGKKTGEEVGVGYSYVENIENFKDKSMVILMSQLITERPDMAKRFVIINRNYKTYDGSEVSGQWAKQIKDYLEEKGQHDLEWVIDLGGKSGTLYHLEQGIYFKKNSLFNENTPNSFIKTPDKFIAQLDKELDILHTAGFDLKKMAIIQTGKFRDGQIKGIFSSRVVYHNYIDQKDEAEYEAIDFMKTVLKVSRAGSFTLNPVEDNKIVVTPHPEKWFITILFENLWYSILG